MGRLLFVGAHPDDETFFAAGTFAKSIAAGHDVAVWCATRGQQGKTGGVCNAAELPAVRKAELHAAMAACGVHDVTILNYQDRDLVKAPADEVRRLLTAKLRAFRPDVAMTFDPYGGNAHSDHIAISGFTTDALAVARDGRWFPELGPAHAVSRVLWTPPVFIYKHPPERDMFREPGFDFVVDVSQQRQQKESAFRAHATQFPGLKKLFFDDENGQRTFHLEAFRLAWGKPPVQFPAGDIWEGL